MFVFRTLKYHLLDISITRKTFQNSKTIITKMFIKVVRIKIQNIMKYSSSIVNVYAKAEKEDTDCNIVFILLHHQYSCDVSNVKNNTSFCNI